MARGTMKLNLTVKDYQIIACTHNPAINCRECLFRCVCRLENGGGGVQVKLNLKEKKIKL